MTEHIRLLSLASRFLAAATELGARGGQTHRFPVPHYLAGHAIELALKAHLVHGGADEEAITKLGHRLEAALGRAEDSVRAVLTPQQVAAIGWLNPFYAGKQLEYTVWGGSGRLLSFPDLSHLIAAASNLVNHLDRTFRAERRARAKS